MVHRGDERKADRPQAAPAGRPTRPSADHRIGDAERQQVIDVLRAHTGAGRLTLDEFSDLVGDVYAAQTYAELEAVGPEPAARRCCPSRPARRPPARRPGAGRRRPRPSPAPTAPAGRRRQRFVGDHERQRRPRPLAARRPTSGPSPSGAVSTSTSGTPTIEPVRVDVTAWAIMGGVDGRSSPRAPGSSSTAWCSWAGRRTPRAHVDPEPGTAHDPGPRPWAVGRRDGAVAQDPGPAGRGDRGRGRRRRRHRSIAHPRPARPGPARAAPAHPRRRRRHHPRRCSPARHPCARTAAARTVAMPRPGRRGRPDPASAPVVRAAVGERVERRAAGANGSGDAAAAPGPSGTLTMMVTDIVGSTRLAEQPRATAAGSPCCRSHNDLVRAAVARPRRHRGQGPGRRVPGRVPSARRAILAAIDVQQAVAVRATSTPTSPLTLRIGLHTGEIVDIDGDVLGQNVDRRRAHRRQRRPGRDRGVGPHPRPDRSRAAT